jgi:hypothetical protein
VQPKDLTPGLSGHHGLRLLIEYEWETRSGEGVWDSGCGCLRSYWRD